MGEFDSRNIEVALVADIQEPEDEPGKKGGFVGSAVAGAAAGSPSSWGSVQHDGGWRAGKL